MTLVARMIANHTRAGQVIADPFLGSGSTLMVAEVMGRDCRGMEIDPAYCDVIIDRYAKLRAADPGAYFKRRERRNGG
jgi:DNA modification methylase